MERKDYKVGDKINHKLFGDGIIIKIEDYNSDELLTIRFADKNIKFMAQHAKIIVL